MKIGLVQNNILWENKLFNLNSSKDIFKKAKDHNIDLLLFPELSFTGFSMSIKNLADFHLETVNYISSLCKSYHINAGIGYIEGNFESIKGKNNYALIDSRGKLLCNYTKIHPFSYANEDKYYEAGNDLNFCTINDIDICPLICYDLRFPELFQIASKKCDLITVAANWPASRKDHWITLLKSRAIENQCYIAGINRTGIGDKISYSGNSMIIDPSGKILSYAEDNEEDLIIADINKERVQDIRNAFPLKKDRRENLYCNLLNSTV